MYLSSLLQTKLNLLFDHYLMWLRGRGFLNMYWQMGRLLLYLPLWYVVYKIYFHWI